jgi:hypothetical protein
LLLLLAACNGGNGPAAPTSTPAPSAVVTGQAAVTSVTALVLESDPLQVNVIARGNLPDACTAIDQVQQGRDGNTFTITLTTTRLADAACAAALTAFEQIIALDVAGLTAGAYTVTVNGVSQTFTLTTDNVSPGEEATPAGDTPAGTISGLVWHDLCAVTGGEGGEPAEPSAGCLAAPAGGFRANGVYEEAEPGIGGVVIDLGQGACPTAGLATATTDEFGNFTFDGLAAGEYCLSIDATNDQNSSLLIPGDWTFPEGSKGGATVQLAEGENLADANFGWDYQFLPEPEAADCTNIASFVADLTIPDDTEITAGESFTKTWQLYNNGDCTWGPSYSLVFVSGEQMDAPESTPLPVVEPGSTVDLSLLMVAPAESGDYRGDWQLRDPNGLLFGPGDDPIWVQIVVP